MNQIERTTCDLAVAILAGILLAWTFVEYL